VTQIIPDMNPESAESVPSDDIALHDGLIQSIYGVGLKLEYCISLVDESPEQAKAGLEAAIIGLSDVIVQIRSRIYEIQ